MSAERKSNQINGIRMDAERNRRVEEYKRNHKLHTQSEVRRFRSSLILSDDLQDFGTSLYNKFTQVDCAWRFVGPRGVLSTIEKGVQNLDGSFNIDMKSYRNYHGFMRDCTLHYACDSHGEVKLSGVYKYHTGSNYNAGYYHASDTISHHMKRGGFVSSESTLVENPELMKSVLEYGVFLEKKSIL